MSDDSFDDLRPRSWLDAFPWIKGASGHHGDAWWDEAIDDVDALLRRRRLAQISELAMQRLMGWSVGQIFPGLAPELALTQLRLPVRASNALRQRGYVTAGELEGVTVETILDWRQVGVGTVDAILQALADASTSVATPDVTSGGHRAAPVVLPFDEVRMPEWISSLVNDLSRIATWYATVGLPGQPLLGVPLPPESPDEIVKARKRLESLCADEVLVEGELEMDVARLFDDALRSLDPRAARILAARLFSDEPTTLDQIGREHGVTRERIRQIEGKARGAMLGLVSDGGILEMVADAARTLIGTIRPLDDLLSLMPALGRLVELAGQPAWRVLDRLDDAYEIQDGWCVVPTVKSAQELTQAQLQEKTDQYGVVRLDSLSLIETSQPERLPELTATWLTNCGYVVDGDYVLTRTQSVQDYGAAVLSIAGSPLSAQEIVDRFVVDRSAASLRNAMSSDDRFERVDRDRWALAEWGMDAYAGVRSVIREQVARSGGRARLEDLVEFITNRYSVTASSVTAYASSPPFQLREGIVSLASADREVRKTPERTRRLFRRSDGWAYRVRITTDHLRGSGSVAPVAIAGLLNLQFGETRQLESPLGPQVIGWTGIQPSFGTIRRFLMEDDIAAGTEAFLALKDDGTFAFEPARELTGKALLDALSLTGAAVTHDYEAARRVLAAAIGLPEASPVVSIIGGYRERGDSDIAELLLSVRDELEIGHAPDRPPHTADVDDILDLL